VSAVLSIAALSACTVGATRHNTGVAQLRPAGIPSGVQQATTVPTDVPNAPELRGHVKIDSCAQAKGGWEATGTASNPGSATVDYSVTIFFTTDRGTVIGTGRARTRVPGGKTGRWSVSVPLTAASGTRCILRRVA
jgi:hypothetical protein